MTLWLETRNSNGNFFNITKFQLYQYTLSEEQYSSDCVMMKLEFCNGEKLSLLFYISNVTLTKFFYKLCSFWHKYKHKQKYTITQTLATKPSPTSMFCIFKSPCITGCSFMECRYSIPQTTPWARNSFVGQSSWNKIQKCALTAPKTTKHVQNINKTHQGRSKVFGLITKYTGANFSFFSLGTNYLSVLRLLQILAPAPAAIGCSLPI